MAKLKIRVYLFLVRAVLRLLAEVRPKGYLEEGSTLLGEGSNLLKDLDTELRA